MQRNLRIGVLSLVAAVGFGAGAHAAGFEAYQVRNPANVSFLGNMNASDFQSTIAEQISEANQDVYYICHNYKSTGQTWTPWDNIPVIVTEHSGAAMDVPYCTYQWLSYPTSAQVVCAMECPYNYN